MIIAGYFLDDVDFKHNLPEEVSDEIAPPRPKRTGGLAIFFRKVNTNSAVPNQCTINFDKNSFFHQCSYWIHYM